MNPRKWGLRAQVYSLLIGAIFICLVIWVVGKKTGGDWADTWMPNFIAEWSGIFIAVALIDQLLKREREREEKLLLAPLRLMVANDIVRALQHPLIWAAGQADFSVSESEPATTFYSRWRAQLSKHPPLDHPGWFHGWAAQLEQMPVVLSESCARYGRGLSPLELASLRWLADRCQFEAQLARDRANLIKSRLEGGATEQGLGELCRGGMQRSLNGIANLVASWQSSTRHWSRSH